MGNVQSETTQESESAKDGEEKAPPNRTKPPDRGPRSGKHEPESRSSSLPVLEAPAAAGQALSCEPEGGDRHPGTPEMGKTHSKKSKLKLSSMWAQNLATGGIKEASRCDSDPGAEKRGLACLSRTELHSRQVAVLQEEPKGLKVVLRPPQGGAAAAAPAATDARDSSTKKLATKGKSKPESGQPDQNVAGRPQQPPGPPLEKVAALGPVAEVPKEVTDTETSWTQHARASAKEGSEKAAHLAEPLTPSKKQPPGVSPGPDRVTDRVWPGPRFQEERNASRPAPSGARKTLLSWGQKEKEPAGQTDRTPGCDGDSKGLASTPPSSLSAEPPQLLTSPEAKAEASEREGKAGTKEEPPGADAVGSETMQELLEKGINFLCKVTIQPGQRPPSVKPAKPKPTVLSPGVSYADILKQCPQKKVPEGAPALPKALHHLSAAGKKLPAFKGLERSHPEDFSLTQLFLEHFKEASPKELAPHAPNQQVVTFFEEFSSGSPNGTEWQRPRPPTPYPQRRKGQGRKLPRFGTAVSQVVAFLGSNPKGDWFVQDEGPRPPDEATGAAGEVEGKGHVSSPGGGAKTAEEPGFFQPLLPLFSEQEIPMDIDDPPLIRPPRRPQGPEEGAKDTIPVKMTAGNASRGVLGPVAAAHSLQKDEATPVPSGRPAPHSPRETLEPPRPASAAPIPAPVGLVPDPKAPAAGQARPKVRKQGSSAPKSKEKLKSSGQSKAKTPKGKGHKQWPRGYGMTPALRLEGPPLFPPFEKVATPFYFGEPLEAPLSLDKPAGVDSDATATQASPKEDREADGSPAQHWPAFQVSESCPMKCYCKHQAPRKLPKNVVAWLNPSSNHLAEPPWVATATLAVSLVAGTKFCLDAYKQQYISNED
ncbi:hypothetical protein JRQ81_011442 [Phrynocephalus forsythii]|uniref:Gametogenetin n=1 Tax=Phrynocephalus forsythii TaxID=171643 RepID=A0A9Q1AQ55_9SAUR|nr:hypothetical protein JRQ81_011442 [Phrynocephalus forsythii]